MKFRKIVSVALSAALIASSVSLSAFAKETEDKTYHYVALGDSITSGFGLENDTGLFIKEPTLILNEELLANPIKSAYPAVFGEYLEELGQANGYTTTTANLAAVAYRAEDVENTILTENYIGPVIAWIINQTILKERLPEFAAYHDIYQKYIGEADLVSVLIGGNDVVLNILVPMCSNENPVICAAGMSLIFILAGVGSDRAVAIGKQIIENNKDSIDYQTIAAAAEYMANIDMDSYIALSANNAGKVIDAVRTVNDTADIALLGMFSPYGNSLVYEGQVRDMSNVVRNIFARAAEELTNVEIDVSDTEEISEEELAEKTTAYSKYVDRLKKLSDKVTGYNKAVADKLVSIVSEEAAYPLQYWIAGKSAGKAMQNLNGKLRALADEKGCIFVDVYDISNEYNIDPHPDEQGHKDIADIMRDTLTDTVVSRMTGKEVPAVEKVTLSNRSVTITAGHTCKLDVTVAPYHAPQSVKWLSSNKSVAAVDSRGVVVAKKAGTAIITATAENGKKAFCTVTVNKKPSVLQTILKKFLKK